MPPIVLRAKPPVLRTESADEYVSLHAQLIAEVEPKGPIEKFYVEEMAALIWEMRRLRNCKISAIRQAFPMALQNILKQLLSTPSFFEHFQNEARAMELASSWFQDPAKQKDTLEILRRFDLDKSAIEVEAITVASDQLEWLDNSLAVTGARIDKTLRMVMDYRGFADRLRRHSDQALIEHDNKNNSVV